MNLQLQGLRCKVFCSADLKIPLTAEGDFPPRKGRGIPHWGELRHLVGFFLLAGILLTHHCLQPRFADKLSGRTQMALRLKVSSSFMQG